VRGSAAKTIFAKEGFGKPVVLLSQGRAHDNEGSSFNRL